MNKKLVGLIIGIVVIGGLLYVNLTDFAGGIFNKNISNEDMNTEEVNQEVNSEQDEYANSENEVSETDIDADDFVLEVGKEALDFTLIDIEGNEVSLSDYRGKYVLVNFWATWCHFCVQEMTDLESFNNENEDVVVLAVNVKESKAEAEKFVGDGGYTFTTLLDDKGEVSNDYLVAAFPTSYIIDKEGIFLGRVQGMMTYEQMNDVLAQVKE